MMSEMRKEEYIRESEMRKKNKKNKKNTSKSSFFNSSEVVNEDLLGDLCSK
jgi:hypothetical protein